MLKLSQALPQFAQELSRGLISLGYTQLAASVDSLEIVERCKCDEPGCVTFYAVPKLSAPHPDKCQRIIAPVRGVTCIQVSDQQITWVEVLGRPELREKLDQCAARQPGDRLGSHTLDEQPIRNRSGVPSAIRFQRARRTVTCSLRRAANREHSRPSQKSIWEL